MADFLVDQTEGVGHLDERRERVDETASCAVSQVAAGSVRRVDVTATLTQGRQHFSDLVELANGGKNVLLHERGKPRAMIIPIPPDRLCIRLAKR